MQVGQLAGHAPRRDRCTCTRHEYEVFGMFYVSDCQWCTEVPMYLYVPICIRIYVYVYIYIYVYTAGRQPGRLLTFLLWGSLPT